MDKYASLHPDLQRVYTEAKAAYIKAHPGDVPLPSLNETYRSDAVQTAYYAQGRKPLATVNALRQKAGIYLIGEEENKKKITNALPGQSAHNFLPSRALDVIFTKQGKSIWDEKYYTVFATYMQAAAKQFGVDVTCGAFWKMKDFPHTELTNWRKMH